MRWFESHHFVPTFAFYQKLKCTVDYQYVLKRFKGCVIFIISPYTLCPLSRSTNLKQYYIQLWKSRYKNKNTLLLTKLIDNGYTSDLIALINYTLVIIRNGKQKQLENICYILDTVIDHDLPADVIKYILRVIELL